MESFDIVGYIDQCASKGKLNPKDICDDALIEYNLVDEELKKIREAEKNLQPRRGVLAAVLRSFGQELPGEKIITKEVIKTDVSFNDLIGEQKDLIAQVCKVVENAWNKKENVVSPRFIMETLSIDEEDDDKVINSIKWLGSKKIITRTAEKTYIPGNNWEQRPNQ